MTQFQQALTLFLSLLSESFPFLLLGVFLSSWLLVFVREENWLNLLPHHPFLGALVGSSFGFILPIFQYGNIPIIRRLLLQKVPVSVVMSFLVAAPLLNPISLWFTWKAFPEEPSILGFQLVFGGAIAIAIGSFFGIYTNRKQKSQPVPEAEILTIDSESSLVQSGTMFAPQEPQYQNLKGFGKLRYGYLGDSTPNQSFSGQMDLFLDNTIRELLEFGSILMLACAATTLVQTLIPQSFIFHWGQTSALQILALMSLSSLLSMGSTANTVLAGTLALTFTKESVLALILWGAILDLKQVALMFAVFPVRVVIYFLILVWQLTFLLTLFMDFYLS